MGWTEDRVNLLRKLWEEGRSASQIAKELGGVNRNQVIGKIHRLGLAGRAMPAIPKRTYSAQSLPARIGVGQNRARQTIVEASARKVFVSHATKQDGTRATSLANSLEAIGCGCWIAPRDIPAGAEWNKTVLRAVEASAVFLLLVSNAAAESAFVQAEVHRALDCRIQVLQVMLDANVDTASIDMRLLRVQRVDATNCADDEIARRIVTAIGSL